MCVYSMIADHYLDKWGPKYPQPLVPLIPGPDYPPPFPLAPFPITPLKPVPEPLTAEEVNELRRLLKKAKLYDEETGQKDCEVLDKKKRLKGIIESQGLNGDLP